MQMNRLSLTLISTLILDLSVTMNVKRKRQYLCKELNILQ